jgi:PST family polysaccharide transporter
MNDYSDITAERPSVRGYVTTTGKVSAARLVQTLLGFVRTKIVALLLGTVGVGLVSIAQQAYQFISTVTTLGLQTTMVKIVASARRQGDMQRVSKTVSASFLVFLFSAVLFGALLVIFSNQIAELVFRDREQRVLVYILAAGAPAANAWIFLLGIANASKRMAMVARNIIVGTTVGLIVVYPMVRLWGEAGALGSLFVFFAASSVHFAVTLHRVRDPVFMQIRPFSTKWVDKSVLRVLFGHSFVNLVRSLGVTIIILAVRAMIIEYEGPEGNGIFQAAWLTFGMIALLVEMSLFYILPRMSEVSSGTELRDEVNAAFRFLLSVYAPLTLLAISARLPIVLVTTSRDFLSAVPLAGWLGVGRLIDIIGMVFTTVLFARHRLAAFLVVELLRYGGQFFGAMVLLEPYGLYGVVVGTVAGQIIGTAASYIFVTRALRSPIENSSLLRYIAFAVAAAVVASFPMRSYLVSATAFTIVIVLTVALTGWLRMRDAMVFALGKTVFRS